MEELAGNKLIIALAVIVCLANVLSAIWKGVEAFKKLNRTEQKEARELAQEKAISDLGARVTRCEERLTRGDVQFVELRGDMTQVLKVMSAELMHFISGNDHKALRTIKDELDSYMAKR